MNFSLTVKNELIAGAPRAACCKRAYAHGLFFDMAQTRDHTLVLTLSSADARREAMRLYRDLYRKEALMNQNRLLFSSERLYAELTGGADFFACEHCRQHFLRGLLISVGSITDPAKAYRLEIRLRDPGNLPFLASFFEECGWQPHCRATKDGVCLNFRKSETIEDILAFAGASQGVFEYINAKIAKEIRNTENRATNCVTRNIKTSVGASGKCCEAISYLKMRGKLETLPEELRETARLRTEHPDVSLSELAFLHNPSITKSGLNHRLQKIMEMAASLKEAAQKREQ